MLQSGRSVSSGGYRYGYQGQEVDNDMGGLGQHLNYTYRNHDSWTCRFGSVDPLWAKYPYWSPYAFSGNRVIDAVELEGLEARLLNDDTAPETGGSSSANTTTNTSNASTTPTPIIPIRQPNSPTPGVRPTPTTPTPNVRPIAPTVGAAAEEAGIAMRIMGSATRVVGIVGILGMILTLSGDERRTDTQEEEQNYVSFYRAMSMNEYKLYNGYLNDRNKSGEGPHVRQDIGYIENAKFISLGAYDVIVEYKVSKEKAQLLNTTPYIYTPGQGEGKPIFNGARNSGLWYIKYEKGISYGFPGESTNAFNNSLIEPPKIIKTKQPDGTFK